ncbi:MAG TPA: hypothetical protein VFK52_01110 [Nocardioidaceae bacterium]|nr:hypothetical protein [Nocardioidaceae bacterium]
MTVDLSMLLTVVIGFVTVNLGSVYFMGQRLGTQIDRLETRVDHNVGRIEGRIDRFEGRIDVLHDSVADMGARITRLEDRLGDS